jgi:hypothetical protein
MDFWGRGRTYHLGAYDLFRMREWFGANTVNRLLRSLVDDAVTPLLPGPDTAAQMAVYPSLLTTGQKSHVLVYIPKGSAARTQVLLEPEGAAVQALETVPLDGDGRLWHTTLVPVRPGVLKLQAKSGDQKLELAATVTRPLSREHIYFHLDEAGLRRIADSAQGRYAPVSQTVDALENIPARTYSRVSVREVRLWNVTWVLLFLAGLLTVDWVLRRRFGIVL